MAKYTAIGTGAGQQSYNSMVGHVLATLTGNAPPNLKADRPMTGVTVPEAA